MIKSVLDVIALRDMLQKEISSIDHALEQLRAGAAKQILICARQDRENQIGIIDLKLKELTIKI